MFCSITSLLHTAFQVEACKAASRDASLLAPVLLLLTQLAATQPHADALPEGALDAVVDEVRL